MAKLLLNAVRIESDPEASLTVGVQPFNRDVLEQLRTKHRQEYLFRRGGEDGSLIHSVALVDGLTRLGSSAEDHLASEAPWLLGPLTLDALLRLFTKLGREVIGWYLTRQAFDFSCHSWRMFTPAPLPITILYSELIARLLAGLRDVPNWDPDTMLGSIGRTRWFL